MRSLGFAFAAAVKTIDGDSLSHRSTAPAARGRSSSGLHHRGHRGRSSRAGWRAVVSERAVGTPTLWQRPFRHDTEQAGPENDERRWPVSDDRRRQMSASHKSLAERDDGRALGTRRAALGWPRPPSCRFILDWRVAAWWPMLPRSCRARLGPPAVFPSWAGHTGRSSGFPAGRNAH